MEIDKKLNFSLVSPERLFYSSKVWMVTVPGEEGDIGVLSGHAPVLSSIRPGLINVFLDEDNSYTQKESFFVSKGFARINASGCTVLAEDIVPISKLDSKELEEELKKLLSDISLVTNDKDKVSLQLKIDSIEKKLEVLNSN